MQKALFFATKASPHLVEPILNLCSDSLIPAKYRLGNFVDGEIMFYLDEPVKDKACVVLGHTSASAENLLSMLTIINTIRINGAKRIIAVIPYYGYGRSDKPKPLQPMNARLIADFLKHAGATKLICLNLHSELVEGFQTVPLMHLSAMPALAEYFQKLGIDNLAVASPDKGGARRALEFAKHLGQKHIIQILKSRPSDTTAEIRSVTGEVKGKNVILVDDMIETGNTLIEAAKALKKKDAHELYAAVTHCVYPAKGIELLSKTSLFSHIVITNSLTNHKELPNNITILDISPLISQAIRSSLA